MEISVVVPTYNNRDVLRETLRAVCDQTFPPDRYEVVVADDGSTDGTAEMVEGFSSRVPVRYVTQQNRGRAAARNLGAQAARGRILVFLDSDLWATPTLLAEHYRHYPPGVRRRGVQGRSLTHPASRVTPFMKVKEITPDLTLRRRHNLSPFHVTTRNFSLLRQDLLDAGGFDEAFTGYGWEDIELALRLRRLGVRFEYEPAALGYHYHVEELEQVRSKLRQAGKGAVYFWQKYDRSLRLGLFLEIAPALLPLKWLVYRTPLVTPFIRWLLPRAEAREWLLVLNECYNHLLWEAYYDGVFEALRETRAAHRGPARRELPVAGSKADPSPPSRSAE